MKLSKIFTVASLAIAGGVIFEKLTGKTLSGVIDKTYDKVKNIVSNSDDLFEESDHPNYQVGEDDEGFPADLDEEK